MSTPRKSSKPAAGQVDGTQQTEPLVADAATEQTATTVELPEDLTTLDETQLGELHQAAQAEFDSLYEGETAPDVEGLARANELVGIIEDLRAESGRRDEEREQAAAQMAELRHRVHGDDTADTTEVTDESDGGEVSEVVEGEVVDAEPALVADARQGGARTTDRSLVQRGKRTLNGQLRKMAADPGARQLRSGPAFDTSQRKPTVSLQQAAQYAPDPRVPAAVPDGQPLVAAADLESFRVGDALPTAVDIAQAMHDRVRNATLTRGAATRHKVAGLERKHQFSIGDKLDAHEINQVLRAATDQEVLIAAGGWCAPPTTSYDFYNIVCTDGILDLPTVGVPRGSIQFPISPSFNDVMGLDDNPWTWTNADDIDALTNPDTRKPCQRTPCPETDEETLACDGICLTVGNLVDFAWPELVANHVRLLMAAHAHYMNTRRIQALAFGSVAVTPTSLGAGAVAPILSALDLQAWDMRERFRMCSEDILEVVLPRWVIGLIAADISLRQGLSPQDAFVVGLTQFANWLDSRNLRAQFVSDWQIGAAGQLGGATPATQWPTTVQALLYPAGTWVLGEGLRLSLGVIRDSVLNASNDHTAAWMEECTLVARIGHQSRLINIEVCPNGNVHAGSQIDCEIS